jgi:predicted RNase H-like nuclease (RuvC/YqgF family)
MAKHTITEASKLVKISRSNMYKKYINTGKISVEVVDGVKQIDTSELVRVFGSISLEDSNDVQKNTTSNTRGQEENTAKDEVISLLKDQLREAREREEWLRVQLEKTTQMLEHKGAEPEQKRKKFLGIF